MKIDGFISLNNVPFLPVEFNLKFSLYLHFCSWSIYLFIDLSLSLFIHLSICILGHLSIYLPIQLAVWICVFVFNVH